MIAELPVSVRSLARAAGVSHVSLLLRRDGQRTMSDGRLLDVVAALRKWSCEFGELGAELEKAVRESLDNEVDRG